MSKGYKIAAGALGLTTLVGLGAFGFTLDQYHGEQDSNANLSQRLDQAKDDRSAALGLAAQEKENSACLDEEAQAWYDTLISMSNMTLAETDDDILYYYDEFTNNMAHAETVSDECVGGDVL